MQGTLFLDYFLLILLEKKLEKSCPLEDSLRVLSKQSNLLVFLSWYVNVKE